MKRLIEGGVRRTAVAAAMGALLLAAGAVAAQPGPGGGPGPRFGAGVTPGWAMMTPEERAEHQQAMAGFKTHDECAAYRDRHHADMAARMKERGQTMPAQPRRDVCAGLPK